MNEEKKRGEIVHKNSDLEIMKPNTPGNLLDSALNELSQKDQEDLKKKVLEEKLKLDVSEKKADQRFYDSSRDMANTIKVVHGLESSTKSDYDVRSSFETASGKTDIHIKKNNNTVIVIVAIVIGIIILILVKS